MLARRIIPCLDVTDGKVVKGVKFQNLEGVGDPPTMAMEYERQGADEIVFLDITASSDARRTMLDMVERTAEGLFVPLTMGGGVRTRDDMRAALNAGADKVSVNTAAVHDPNLINACARDFGSQCVVLAIDAKREHGRWKVWTHGGRQRTELDAADWAYEAQDRGAGEILLTSMDADGTTDGYDIPLTQLIADSVSIPVIASGGCGSPEHMLQVFQETGASAALAASIFHYGRHTVGDVKKYLIDRGVAIR